MQLGSGLQQGAATSAVKDGKTTPTSGFSMINAISIIKREEDVRNFVKLTCGNVIIGESGENYQT